MTNSLPHAQKLYEEYKSDERVRVVAVATAFEKEKYPWMADMAKIRARLKTEGWKFPVMRDKNEDIINSFSIGTRAGTPTTVVMDRTGEIRWHGFNTTKKTAAEVTALVTKLAAEFYVDPVESFLPELSKVGVAYTKGKYDKAHKLAAKLIAAKKTSDEAREQAEVVVANLNGGVQRLIDDSKNLRKAGYPSSAQKSLERAAKMFKKVPKLKEAMAALAALKSDVNFKRELTAEKTLLKVQASIGKPKADKAALRKQLDNLRESCRGLPIFRRIMALQRSI